MCLSRFCSLHTSQSQGLSQGWQGTSHAEAGHAALPAATSLPAALATVPCAGREQLPPAPASHKLFAPVPSLLFNLLTKSLAFLCLSGRGQSTWMVVVAVALLFFLSSSQNKLNNISPPPLFFFFCQNETIFLSNSVVILFIYLSVYLAIDPFIYLFIYLASEDL